MRHGRMVGVLTTLGVMAEMVMPSPASAAALTIPISKHPTPTYGTENASSPERLLGPGVDDGRPRQRRLRRR